ncbi:MAG: hypothetical protein Q9M89_05360 [Persephonella sp.]|nr:hypothetical protein [Persephonella sp.]
MRPPQINRPPRMRGVVGLAVDFVEYDPAIEKAVRYVFGDTVIVQDFDTARMLGIGTYRMVTVEGEIFEKSGTITGGTDKNRGIIGKGNLEAEKIRLEKEDDRLKAEEKAMEEELKRLEGKISLTGKELYQLSNENQNVMLRSREIEEKIDSSINRINLLEEEILSLKKKQLDIEDKLEVVDRHILEVERQLSQVQKRKEELFKKMESEGLHRLRKEWEEATQKVYTLREKRK